MISTRGNQPFRRAPGHPGAARQIISPGLLTVALGVLFLAGASAQSNDPTLNEALRNAGRLLEQAGTHAADPGRRLTGPLVRLFSDVSLAADTDCTRVALLFGDAKIQGNVRENLFVFWGDAELNGRVDQDVRVFFGTLRLGPNADLRRDTSVIGGRLERAPGARLAREPVTFGGGTSRWPVINDLTDWFKYGFFLGRPVVPAVRLSWWLAGLFFLGYLLLSALLPGPVQRCAITLRDRPASVFLTGLLAPIPFLLLSVILTATGIGLVLVPFVLTGGLFAIFLGKAAVLQLTGQRLARLVNSANLRNPWIALTTGAGVFCLLYAVPLVGMLVWGLTVILGLGCSLLSVADTLREERAFTMAEPEAPRELLVPATTTDAIPAGFWIRGCAMLLDWMLVATLCMITFTWTVFLPLLIVYYVAMWTWKGTSLGSLVMRIRLARDDGRPVDFAVAFVRSLASIFSLAAFGIGFLWSALSRDKKSWHDTIAGTNVVHQPATA